MAESLKPPHRLVDVFPPGFDSKSKSSSSRGPYQFAPEQLYRTLTHAYAREHHVESTIVTSAWYGKQKNGARHEFILIEVEDTEAGFKNFIVLDRNNSKSPPVESEDSPGLNLSPGGIGCSRSCQSAAADAFRVSYNGIEKQLLRECQLQGNQYLEMIKFGSEGQLFLYQLVTLVHLVSESSQNYAVAGRNCYWFAGVIWECIRALHPSAEYDGRRSRIRGKFAMMRYTPNTEDIHRICQEFEQEIRSVEDRLAQLREKWFKMEGTSFEMTAVASNDIMGSGSPFGRRPGPVGDMTPFRGNNFDEGVAV
ncbi:unnamed protein product [Rhizoctonia solani]|uniref:Uncharacterized protein n=1 Tax=Rhizoctonia solani TaxID=456999 RepID=A0A8H3CVC9_9AGAM|nr:unnamed protein product [Rhizoctonia solani]